MFNKSLKQLIFDLNTMPKIFIMYNSKPMFNRQYYQFLAFSCRSMHVGDTLTLKKIKITLKNSTTNPACYTEKPYSDKYSQQNNV